MSPPPGPTALVVVAKPGTHQGGCRGVSKGFLEKLGKGWRAFTAIVIAEGLSKFPKAMGIFVFALFRLAWDLPPCKHQVKAVFGRWVPSCTCAEAHGTCPMRWRHLGPGAFGGFCPTNSRCRCCPCDQEFRKSHAVLPRGFHALSTTQEGVTTIPETDVWEKGSTHACLGRRRARGRWVGWSWRCHGSRRRTPRRGPAR